MRSRVATSSVASAVTVSWKTGACPRLRETASDRLARGRELDDLDVGGGRSAGRSRRRAGRGVLDVLGDDAAFWPRAGDLPDVDASLARDPPRERARLHVLAGRTRRGRGLRRVIHRDPARRRCIGRR